jgi:hypothetical protein
MNSRHAAAFALAGWCLLVPPIVLDAANQPRVQPTAPLNEWRVYSTFESREQCENLKYKIQEGERRLPPSEKNAELKREAAASLLCVASDDPRLKGN